MRKREYTGQGMQRKQLFETVKVNNSFGFCMNSTKEVSIRNEKKSIDTCTGRNYGCGSNVRLHFKGN